jgi:hypothetical protein
MVVLALIQISQVQQLCTAAVVRVQIHQREQHLQVAEVMAVHQ